MQLQRALVTGASVGIGRAIATELAGRGTHLVLVARNEAQLKELADELSAAHGIEAEVLPADLTLAGDRARVEQRVAEAPEVDCVVNNAGIGTFGDLAGSDPASEQQVVELNVTALLRLTQVAAQTFNARRRGAILNVSSIASFQSTPQHVTYGATKAFVTSLTLGLREELEGSGVHVTTLCPGYTRTEIHERNDWKVEGFPGWWWTGAAQVAREGVAGLLEDRAMVVPGIVNKALVSTSVVSPPMLSRRLARVISEFGSRLGT